VKEKTQQIWANKLEMWANKLEMWSTFMALRSISNSLYKTILGRAM